MIPKIIHYCWFGKKKYSPLQKACINTWYKYLKDYKFILWNEENAPMEHPFVSYHYKKKNWAFISDFVRLYAIYNYGGIYLDVDFEILKPLDDLLYNNCFLGEELPGRITNAICGAIKGHIFFKKALEFMENRHFQKKTVMITPEVCTIIYNRLKNRGIANDIKIYSSEYFYPYNPFSADPQKRFLLINYITSKTYAVHHWGHSWKQGFLKRIIRKLLLYIKK